MIGLAKGQCPHCRWQRAYLTLGRIKRCAACWALFNAAAVETISTLEKMPPMLMALRRSLHAADKEIDYEEETKAAYREVVAASRLVCTNCLKPLDELPMTHEDNCERWTTKLCIEGAKHIIEHSQFMGLREQRRDERGKFCR